MPHKALRPEDITAIIDTREKKPWPLTPLKTIRGTLRTGDYSIQGLSDHGGICIERKSLGDLLGCIGSSRRRFEAELERMQAYTTRCVIVECSFKQFDQGAWLSGSEGLWSNVHPSAAMASVLGWMAQGVPFLFCDNKEMASISAARLMFLAARRRFRELGGFYDSLKLESKSVEST